MVTLESIEDDLSDLNLSDKDIIRIVEKYCECTSPEYKMKYDVRFKKESDDVENNPDYYCKHCKKVIRIAYKLHMMENHGEYD